MTISPRIAIVSDTVDDINGVALGLRRFVAASSRAGHVASLVGPQNHAVTADDVVRIPAALSATLPFYAQMTWSVPDLPALVDTLARTADLVQVATPGPMGIAALIAARMLRLPAIAQYHTEVADYAAVMTGLPFVRELVAPIVGWFYQQAELCLAPSAAVELRLGKLGVPAARIQRIVRGVDLELFHPGRRSPGVLPCRRADDAPVALYVGRLSKEKNLDTLLAAWKLVHATHPQATLLVVGDGPYASAVVGPNVLALGARHGEELAMLFASADVFAFPSETETFGNVVLEAAASGLPVVVAAAGAAHEHVLDGITGDVRDGRDPAAFAAAIAALFDDKARRRRMGDAARTHAIRFDLARAVTSTWQIYDSHARGARLECAS
jgi:glycosyltransferase involved in cell wall biosynthesis